jgi:hypothetical protein
MTILAIIAASFAVDLPVNVPADAPAFAYHWAWIGLALVAGYYVAMAIALRWRPQRRVSVTRYEPPRGLSPAVAAYLAGHAPKIGHVPSRKPSARLPTGPYRFDSFRLDDHGSAGFRISRIFVVASVRGAGYVGRYSGGLNPQSLGVAHTIRPKDAWRVE